MTPWLPWLTLAAFTVEALFGYPAWLRVPHPVVWAGGVIARLDQAWNRPRLGPGLRRGLGAAAILLVLGLAAGLGLALERLPLTLVWLFPVVILAGSTGMAARSLSDHVEAVARALGAGDLPQARRAVGRIVGRDVEALDEDGVAAAAIESLAESFNDGIVAPVFWMAIGGLPLLFAFKALNTADSMIGHKEERWRAFGWAAARLDDLANLAPARIAALLLVLAAGRGGRVAWRDARRHASPNAGWPEAAMAGALDRRLGGPAAYDGVTVDRPRLGDGAAPQTADLSRALDIYAGACCLLAGGLVAWGCLWLR